jgi:hypothetical protein
MEETIVNTVNNNLATKSAKNPTEVGISEASLTPEAATIGIMNYHWYH